MTYRILRIYLDAETSSARHNHATTIWNFGFEIL